MRSGLISLFMICTTAGAQNFVTYTTRDGLSNDKVECMIQDDQGFLWVGTGEGLNRFDGNAFKTFHHIPGDSTTIDHDQVNALELSQDGHIWVSSFGGGFGRFDPRTEKFISWQDLSGLPRPTSNNIYADIFIRHVDSIWVSAESHGILLALPKEKKQILFDRVPDDVDLIIREIVPDPNDQNILWCGANQGLYRFFIATGEFEKVVPDSSIFIEGSERLSVQDLLIDKGQMWMGVWGGGLVHWSMSTDSWSRYMLDNEPPYHKAKNVFKSVIRLKDGSMLSGVENGLAVFDPREKRFFNIEFDENDAHALPDGYTGKLLEARDGVIWIAARKGLVKWDPAINLFRTYDLDIDPENKLVTTARAAIEHEGKFIVGTILGDGLYELDPITNELKVIPYRQSTNAMGRDVHGLLKLNSEKAFVAHQEGYSILDLNTYVAKPVLEDAFRTKGFMATMNLIESGKDWKVVSSAAHKGVFLIDVTNERVIHFGPDEDGRRMLKNAGWPQGLAFDSKGRIWLNGVAGISSIDLDSHLIENFSFNDLPGLCTDYIWDLDIGPEDNIWLGTNGCGLIKTDPEDVGGEGTRSFARFKGLPSQVSSVEFDPHGFLWIGGRSGLYRLDPRSMDVRKFDHSDGLRSSIFHHAEFLFTESDEMIIISQQGSIVIADLGKVTPAEPQPVVRVSSILVNGVPYEMDTVPSYLNSLELDHDQNNIELAFSSIAFIHRSQIRLNYHLEGSETNPRSIGAEGKAIYTGLKPGKYELIVTDNGNGNVLLSFPLVISPAFWQTWWFKVFAGIVFLLSAYFLANWRIRLLQEKQQLEIDYAKRISAMEMSALRSQMNPHFLFNSLNSINRYIIKNESVVASSYLTKFSKLMRLVLQNSKEKTVPLSNELEALMLYMELESLRFKDKFEYSITNHLQPEMREVHVPPLIIQPFVENAIWHGVMHKTNGIGHVTLEIAQRRNELFFVIEDDGVGRKKAQELKSKRATKRRSFGMAITEERLALAQEIYGVKTDVRVTDLFDIKQNPKGTRVEITMEIIPE